MLASDIFCLVLMAFAALVILLGAGLTLDALSRHHMPKWTWLAVGVIAFILMAIMIGAIVSVIIIL